MIIYGTSFEQNWLAPLVHAQHMYRVASHPSQPLPQNALLLFGGEPQFYVGETLFCQTLRIDVVRTDQYCIFLNLFKCIWLHSLTEVSVFRCTSYKVLCVCHPLSHLTIETVLPLKSFRYMGCVLHYSNVFSYSNTSPFLLTPVKEMIP